VFFRQNQADAKKRGEWLGSATSSLSSMYKTAAEFAITATLKSGGRLLNARIFPLVEIDSKNLRAFLAAVIIRCASFMVEAAGLGTTTSGRH